MRATAAPRRFPHVRALDGIRGLAAIAVYLQHSLFTTVPFTVVPAHVAVFHLAPDIGVMGVDLFFVLSGYLITSLLLVDRRRTGYFHNFYVKRAFRILPALVLVLAVNTVFGDTRLSTWILALLFVLNMNELLHVPVPGAGPLWSLSIEEQFYFVWPALVRWLTARRLRTLLVVVVAGEPVLRIISIALHHGRTTYTFTHCDGLAWGGLLALIAFRMRIPWRAQSAHRLWRSFGVPVLLGGTVVAVWEEWARYHQRDTWGMSITFSAMLFAALVCHVITHPASLLARLLRWRPLTYMGDVSYMFYLAHIYLLAYYDRLMKPWEQADTLRAYWVRFAVVGAITLLWSSASLFAYERPIGRLRRRFLQPSRPLPARPRRVTTVENANSQLS